MMNNLAILITDGENRSSLAVTRSLGSAGHQIYVSSKFSESISGSSKFCRKHFRVSDPGKEIEQYKNDILELVNKESIDIVIPMTESTIYSLNSVRHKLPTSCILACQGPDEFDSISNKYELFKKADKFGIPIPKTIYIENRNDLASKINQVPNYPVVIKPGRSKVKKGNIYISSSVKYAGSKDEVLDIYNSTEALNYPSMIQEKIDGPGTGLFTLFDKNTHLALFSHRRLREKPPSGGVSVVCESIDLDEDMVQSSQKLLSSVKWQGVAMVEFKRDLNDGKAKLIEINGRFWGSLQLAISSGVDFPCLLANYLYSEPIGPEIPEYKKNLKLKWFLGTLDHLFIRLKSSNPIKNGFPTGRLNALLEFLKVYDHKTTFDVFKRNDIRPFLTELKQYIGCYR